MVSDVSVTYLLIPFTIRIMKLFRIEIEIRSTFQYRNVLDEGRPSHSRPGRFACFRESTLSLGMLLRFEVTCTLDRFFISSGPSSPSSAMKNCPFQKSSNPGRSTGWTISGIQEVVRIYVHNLAAGFLQLRVGVRNGNRKFCRYFH